MPDGGRGWLLVRNERAGTDDDRVVTAVAGGLASHGPTEIVTTTDGDDLDGALRAADGRVVVVTGGDGSMQLAVERARAAGLLDELVFGLVPLGTGNDLAGVLDVPSDPSQIVDRLTAAVPRPLDLVVSDDDEVVVNAVHIGVGVDAGMLATDLKESFGRLAYPMGAVTAGMAAEGRLVKVELDGHRLDQDRAALMVVVANGSTIGGGTAIVPDATPDDGLLDVVVVHAVDPAPRMAFGSALLRGTHLDRDDVVVGRGTQVTISGSDLSHNRDGELEHGIGSPRRYRVAPGAWRLLC